jgi:hypothetical protein
MKDKNIELRYHYISNSVSIVCAKVRTTENPISEVICNKKNY